MRPATSFLLSTSLLTLAACATDDPLADDSDLEVSVEDTKADGLRGNWVVNARRTETYLGASMLAADMNGDGRLDLLVGGYGVDVVHVYLASEQGLATRAAATIRGDGLFGYQLARLPRAGGDCFAAASKVAPYVSVYCGLGQTPTWTSDGLIDETSSYNDLQLAGGDVNGDGVSDLVIGESGDRGHVWAIHGGGQRALRRSIAWQLAGERDFARLGSSLAIADFDLDGFADLAVGAPADAAGETDGYVRLYRGAATGLGATPAWTRRGPAAGTHYGKRLTTADVNGDGRQDLVVGYEREYVARIDTYHAAGHSFSPGPSRTIDSALSIDVKEIAGGADLDGDGFEDLVVGAPNRARGKGRVMVFRGGANGISTTAAWDREGSQVAADFGATVGVGDVNSDGKPDILVGEPLFDAPSGGGSADWAGRAHVFSGAGLVLR